MPPIENSSFCEIECHEVPEIFKNKCRTIEIPEKKNTADFETAIYLTGYGKFQRILLLVSGMIYTTCAISTTTLSFVLPSAQCDFNLSSADKGKLSAMPLIGMILGCGIWGSIADNKGRKLAILLSLLLDFVAGLTSSFAHTFELFLFCRFLNGFGIIGATSIIFSYLGEFFAKSQRDTALGRLEVFWNVGVIILPGLAWLLLSESALLDHLGNFCSPWRIFVIVCSLPSLISILLLYNLPETPKFLMSKQKYQKAKEVFKKVFEWNTGLPSYEYPVTKLLGEYDYNSIGTKVQVPLSFLIVEKWLAFKRQISMLFEQPYLKFLAFTCFVDFGLEGSYYTFVMWFPEIFKRFNLYEMTYPERKVGVCDVAQLSSLNKTEFSFLDKCDPTIDNQVFSDTLIIGLSSLPASISLSFFMRKFGKKWVLAGGLATSGFAGLSLIFVKSSTQTLILSCIFEALTSILEAVIFCIIVDLFPTKLRALALTITASFGRLGAILGNVAFGLLIDYKCMIPIYVFSFLLLGNGILCIFLPHADNYLVLH